MELRQLIPQENLVEVPDLLSGLRLEDLAGPDRPYTIVNFIASADGRASFRGRSAPLGDPVDREVFHGLREQAEAVLAGVHTIRIENYGRLTRDPERRERRIAAGRQPEPLACLITRSGDVPTEAPIFSETEARIVVFGPTDLRLPPVGAQLEVVNLDPGELTLTTALRCLRSQFGIRSLLCEGGPTLFNGLLHERLADEMFLTLAPKLVGGGMEPAISNGPELGELQSLALVWALESASSLYLRYRLT
ncbi:MAG: dihydrofolate reductase family protein [Solirubrobacterales bacterium]|nr:dihydrofolate reductase family protein [Solirubrobacterales bacterium]